MTSPTNVIVVCVGGQKEPFEDLAAAEPLAIEWAARDKRPVEIWSKESGDLLLMVDPGGTKREPAVPVQVSWREGRDGQD